MLTETEDMIGAILVVLVIIMFILAAMPDDDGCQMVPTSDGYHVEACP